MRCTPSKLKGFVFTVFVMKKDYKRNPYIQVFVYVPLGQLHSSTDNHKMTTLHVYCFLSNSALSSRNFIPT